MNNARRKRKKRGRRGSSKRQPVTMSTTMQARITGNQTKLGIPVTSAGRRSVPRAKVASGGYTHDEVDNLFTGDITITGGLSTWDGTVLHIEGTNASGQLQGTPVQDDQYHVTFDYSIDGGSNVFLRFGGGSNQDFITGTGSYNGQFTAQDTLYLLQLQIDTGSADFTKFEVHHVVHS